MRTEVEAPGKPRVSREMRVSGVGCLGLAAWVGRERHVRVRTTERVFRTADLRRDAGGRTL